MSEEWDPKEWLRERMARDRHETCATCGVTGSHSEDCATALAWRETSRQVVAALQYYERANGKRWRS